MRRRSLPALVYGDLCADGFVLHADDTLRSIGHSHVPLIASACAFGINIGANYVFIFGKLGCPAMGVAGAALGTVVARIVESSVIVGSFLSNKQLRFRIRDLFTPFRDLVGEFLHTSIPVLLSDCLLGLGDNVLAIIMGRIGSGFVTANSITMVIQRVSTIVIMGLAFSGCFQTGQVLGKGEVQAARRQETPTCSSAWCSRIGIGSSSG